MRNDTYSNPSNENDVCVCVCVNFTTAGQTSHQKGAKVSGIGVGTVKE